jgi:hypothetical protein
MGPPYPWDRVLLLGISVRSAGDESVFLEIERPSSHHMMADGCHSYQLPLLMDGLDSYYASSAALDGGAGRLSIPKGLEGVGLVVAVGSLRSASLYILLVAGID